MTQLVFYTTSHCHLCEQAEVMLLHVKKLHEIHCLLQEISHDDQLTAQYGTKIPVIKRVDNQSEINWPFSEVDIVKLIEA